MSRGKAPKTPAQTAAPVAVPASANWQETVSGRAPWIAVGLVLLATVRIVSTYSVFSHTIDEPAHIACGMQWLVEGKYTYETLHTPLARLAVSIGPYLDGARPVHRPEQYVEGAAILYGGDGSAYDRRLGLARAGTLPFFWLAAGVVYLWCARYFDRLTAVVAVLLFTFLPVILAHSGLATTDTALTATLGATMLALVRLAERPTLVAGVLLGLTGGIAILCKLTAMPFFAASVVVALGVVLMRSRPRLAECVRYLPALAAGFLVLPLTIWAGYWFHVGPTSYASFALPAPELFAGINEMTGYMGQGHPSYLLGRISHSGFMAYYPVALAVKTPLPFLALTIAGIWICWRKREARYWAPISFAAGLLGFALWSTVNIGVRHVMPLCLFFSILAAVAVKELAQSRNKWVPKAVLGLLVWMAATSALSHPDYLAYFNALAGDEPEKILVDSDLDWGQDMKRLAAKLQEVGARQVWFNPLVVAHLEAVHGFPPIQATNVTFPEPGWTAVSLTVLKATRLSLFEKDPDIDPWPNRYKPVMRVGKGIYLYHFAAQRPAGTR